MCDKIDFVVVDSETYKKEKKRRILENDFKKPLLDENGKEYYNYLGVKVYIQKEILGGEINE